MVVITAIITILTKNNRNNKVPDKPIIVILHYSIHYNHFSGISWKINIARGESHILQKDSQQTLRNKQQFNFQQGRDSY
jgi:hypothetical protein